MTKISAYAALTSPAGGDVLPVVDVSDTSMAASGTTKKITVADLLAAGGGGFSVLNPAYAGGADPAGVADSTAAWQAALNAIPAGGGAIIVPPGTYKISSTLTCTTPGAYIVCPAGKWATVVNYTGTGACIRMYVTASYSPGIVVGGGILGLMVDGTSASAGACAYHIGDIYQFEINAGARNFQGTGSKGFWFDNNYHWMEQLTGKIWAEQCTAHVVFDNSADTSGVSTGSFDRAILDIFLDMKGKGNGVILQGGTFIIGGRLGIYGNTDYGTSLYYVLTLTGTGSSGYSRIVASTLNIAVECNATSGTQPKTINFATQGSNTIWNCQGIIDFSGNNPLATAVTPNGSFQFSGPVLGDGPLAKVGATPQNALMPSAATGQTFDRALPQSYLATLTSGTVYCSALTLPAGVPVNNITLQVGNAAFTVVTHGWYALLDSTLMVRAVSADQTGGNWASTFATVTLSVAGSAFTTYYAGLYYIAFCAVFSGSGAFPALANPVGGLGAIAPVPASTSSTGQTTPPTTGTTLTALSGTLPTNARFYAYTS